MTNSEYGDFLLSQMPENFRSGSMFTKESDLQTYLIVYLASIVAFFIINYFLRFLFSTCVNTNVFDKKSVKERMRYLEKWTSNVHHVLIVYLTYYNFKNQDCEIEGESFFSNDVCMLQVDSKFVMAELVYLGYMTENFIELKFWINDQDPTAKQMIWHHYLVLFGIACGLHGGYATILVANLASLCEISAIFLNYRSFFTKEEQNLPIPSLN